MPSIPYGESWRFIRNTSEDPNDSLRGCIYDPYADWWVICGTGTFSTNDLFTVERVELANVAPTFVARTPANTNNLYGVCVHPSFPNRVFMCGTNTVQESTDNGVTWSVVDSSTGVWFKIRPGFSSNPSSHATVVAVSGRTDVPNIAKRDLGAATYTLVDSQAVSWYDVAYLDGKGWVCCGGSPSTVAYISTSADAVTWQTAYTLGTLYFKGIDVSPSYWMVIGEDGVVYRAPSTGALPTNAGFWTLKSVAETFPDLLTVRWLGGSRWVVAGKADRFWITEDNGDNWAFYGPLGVLTENIYADFVNQDLICVNSAGAVLYSSTISQEDFAPLPAPETSEPIQAIEDVSQRAIDRLVEQFKG